MQYYKSVFLVVVISFLPLVAFPQINLPHFFSDGMVLQRNKPIKIWGWAKPNSEVQLIFKDQVIESQTDAKGSWTASLLAMPASTQPASLSISNEEVEIEIKDILIGEVWLCSGQSNMEYIIRKFPYAQLEKDNAQFPNIRMFTVQKGLSTQAQEDVLGGAWISAEGQNVLDFSATAYFFGKNLHQQLGVPIGLITSAWGGTNIEAWMPPARWKQFPDIEKVFISQKSALQTIDLETRQKEVKNLLAAKLYDGIGFVENWQSPETVLDDWSSISIPQEKGNELFHSMDGAVWIRKSFEIPLPFRNKDLIANLGQIDDHDIVWVNGHKIGESQNRNDWRNYPINQKYLKKGLNEIVIRIFDYEAEGGYITDPYFINIHPLGDPKGYYLLSGDWKYKIGKTLNAPLKLPKKNTNGGRLPNVTPSALYHQMIHPFRNLAISGAIWYQGETNSSRGYEYQFLFPNMIKGWRNSFEQGDFPFLFVQLPNFRGKNRDGTISNWPELRQAQVAALQLPNTGMAVTIDIGEENNIHPSNKQDVSQRLALAALNIQYHKNVPYQGPSLKKLKQKQKALVLTFEHFGDGLKLEKEAKSFHSQINNFEIAGTDGVFYKAYARILGKNQIKVWSEQVVQPLNVRYAWENNPIDINLYNSYGLPAAPFHTGKLAWKTLKNQYINTLN